MTREAFLKLFLSDTLTRVEVDALFNERDSFAAQAGKLREALTKVDEAYKIAAATGRFFDEYRPIYDRIRDAAAALSATEADVAKWTEVLLYEERKKYGFHWNEAEIIFALRDTHVRAEARKTALEEAAKLCDEAEFIDIVFDGERDHEVPFSKRIRALGDKP